MANDNIQRDSVRIPNLPLGKIVDDQGNPTPDEQTFRQALLTLLQNFSGPEGLVMPTQSAVNEALILANKNIAGQYTCQLGTMLYIQHPTDYTMDKVVIAVRNDNTYPLTPPIFKTVTLT